MSETHCPVCNQTWCCHVGDGHDTPICPRPDVMDDKCPSCLILALRLALAEATRERSLLHERVCELVSLLQTAERERDDIAAWAESWMKRVTAAERDRDDATAAANIRAAEHRKERDLRAQAERERDEAIRILRDIATFGWYAKGAKVARAYLAAREGR